MHRSRTALAPHWAALLALALFLAAGLAVLDDYGVTGDETKQRRITIQNLAHLRGEPDALPANYDKFYGVAFESPLLLAERALGVENWRGVHLLRHLLTHLFFLVGGLFAYLLSRRLFGNRLIALFAMALFLLHPRLFGHSFYNTKDIPFLTMFVVALYLAYPAFKRGGAPAFALLGAAAGLLLNIRLMGAVLIAGILAALAVDFVRSTDRAERKRVLAATGAFALAGALTAYAALPYLWSDPIGRSVEWWATSSAHPENPLELFRGTIYRSRDFPPEYLPVWLSITAPPFALLLGAAGTAAALARGLGTPGQAMRNGRTRFVLLIAGCFALPVAWVVAAGPNIYNGWRQMYFLWAPFSLLGAYGLWSLIGALGGRAPLRAAALGAAAAGLGTTLISMALIHPNEHVFFNFLVDRTTSERLRTQYVMDYWSHPVRQAWELLLRERPASTVEANSARRYNLHTMVENADILPDAQRERTSSRPSLDAVVVQDVAESRFDLALHRLKVYGNTIVTIERKEDLRAAYGSAAAGERILDSVFDVYRLPRSALIVKEPCAPSFITGTVFYLRLFPERTDDLPLWLRADGSETLRLQFSGYGALFDDKCVASVPLPDYPIAEIEARWEPALMGDDEARAKMRQARASGRSLARSVYDAHLLGNELVYVQEPCLAAQTERRFFLHIVPEREEDLPAARRRAGFDNRNFDFHLNGAIVDDACVAVVDLPNYPVASVRTGQFVSGEGEIWRAEFPVGPN